MSQRRLFPFLISVKYPNARAVLPFTYTTVFSSAIPAEIPLPSLAAASLSSRVFSSISRAMITAVSSKHPYCVTAVVQARQGHSLHFCFFFL